jgi:hypothetical protein
MLSIFKNSIITPAKTAQLFAFSAFILVLFGCKLLLINYFGNATPFWDQWDAEAVRLYKPFIEGTLSLGDLVSAHNEHRILTTRLLALLLLYINGIWNPLLQMVVNAFIHVLTLTLLAIMIVKVVGGKMIPIILSFTLILFAFPYAWENTLSGFQSQFYFVILFSIVAIWLIVLRKPFSLGWWTGVCFAILGYFSLASGVFIFATSASVLILQSLFSTDGNKKQVIAAALLITFFLAGFHYTPIDTHQVLKAKSFVEFIDSLKTVMAWPLSMRFLSPVIKNLPAIIFLFIFFKRPLINNDRGWFVIALIIWMLAQGMSISYGRSVGNLLSRYLDLYAIGVFINFACLLSILKRKKNLIIFQILLFSWTICIFLGIADYTFKYSFPEIAQKSTTSKLQEINTRNYIATKNIDFLLPVGKPDPTLMRGGERLDIPFPSAKKLALILDSTSIREILPSNIRLPFENLSFNENPLDLLNANRIPPELIDSGKKVKGNYSFKSLKNQGECCLNYDSSINSRIAIPISGYPKTGGIDLWIDQGGKHLPVSVLGKSEPSFTMGYTKIEKGKFSIRCRDITESSLLAVGDPVVAGSIDKAIKWTLLQYPLLILLGIMCGFICLTISILSYNSSNNNSFSVI